MQHLKSFKSLKSLKKSKIHVMIEGPVGFLEGYICYSDLQNAPLILILPPNPKKNGTMNNKIVNLLFEQFQELNFNVLKINYRGVGLSQGISEGTEVEIADVLCALDWFMKRCEKNKISSLNIYLAGFSYGGWLALQCSMRRPEIANFIIINSQLLIEDFNMLTPCPSGLIVQSDNDILFSTEQAKKFTEQLITQKNCKIEFLSLPDDHYFSENLELLKENLKNYIEQIEKNKAKKEFNE